MAHHAGASEQSVSQSSFQADVSRLFVFGKFRLKLPKLTLPEIPFAYIRSTHLLLIESFLPQRYVKTKKKAARQRQNKITDFRVYIFNNHCHTFNARNELCTALQYNPAPLFICILWIPNFLDWVNADNLCLHVCILQVHI